MPSKQNINKVSELKDKLGKTTAVVLSDYRGLNVAQVQQLKNKIREQEAELTVAKNRLLKIALREKGYADGDELKNALTGPTAVLFCYQDEVGPIKAVYEYAQENKMPELKVGFLGKEFLNTNRLNGLAQLSSKPELEAKLVGTLNAPISGFVNVLGGNIRKLVYVLKAIQTNKN